MPMDRSQKGAAVPVLCAAVVAVATVLTLGPLSAQVPTVPPAGNPQASQPVRATSADLPSARTVIDRHVAAIGGREAILAHSSTYASGSVTIPSAGVTGTFEVFAKKPNKALVKMNIAGVGETVDAFNGTIGWEISPVTGPSLIEGKQLAEKAFDADFYDELHDQGRYQSMQTVERTTFDGRTCYKLRLVRQDGGEDMEFYDAETGLKAGAVTTRETAMGSMNVTLVEADYKKFGKLLQATRATVSAMGLQQVMLLTRIEYDGVPDSVFEPPTNIKALLK